MNREAVALGVPVSIDSMKSDVVAWALDRGAVIANDVWGLQRDAGITFEVLQGPEITEADWNYFHLCYQRTYHDHHSRPSARDRVNAMETPR